jgi:hypothetical protein
MRGMCRLLLPILAFVPPATAGIAVREFQGRVDVAAAAAPLADVLDRLARQTGMRIVYEGPAPRQLVTLSLVGRSPAEAVTAILEGQGLNYALVLDATATRVEKLLVTGVEASGASGSSPARQFPPSTIQPRHIPPEPEPDDPPVEEPPPPDAASLPGPDKTQPQPNPPGSPNGPALPPGMPAAPTIPGLTPVVPAPPAPQPTPTPPPPTPP